MAAPVGADGKGCEARVAALASVPAAAAPVDDEAPDPSARRAAYEALSAWFNDWATTPRTAFDARELVPRPQ